MSKGTNRLSKPKDCGYVISYYLSPHNVSVYLLGFIPLHRIALTDVHYLRLASADEVPRAYYIRNWSHFRPSRAAHCPVYKLQTKARRKRIFLKLRSGAHFRLRRAIGDHKKKP